MAENTSDEIEAVVRRHPDGIPLRRIATEMAPPLPRRTLQYRLAKLVAAGRVVRQGAGRGAVYHPPRSVDVGFSARAGTPRVTIHVDAVPQQLADLRREYRQRYLSSPLDQRPPVGYQRAFLDDYRPSAGYLSQDELDALSKAGQMAAVPAPAGTYARRILDRVLIDLSWNSSRLEGNTYSLLDTKRLIEFGAEGQHRDAGETQMILNHKRAIEFLVDSVDELDLDRRTVLNLHALLADNLLSDPSAPGRLRSHPVGVGASAYRPLDIPALIDETFDRVLETARAIEQPLEQALFCLVQLPYLQAFDDVNKRVSRLAANIPLIKHNLSPLSFNDVPREYYTDALLLIYEQNEVGLMKALFQWAYGRSAARYGAVRQTLGEPDPFRLQYRDALGELVSEVIRNRLGVGAAANHVAAWVHANVEAADRDRFQEIAETELIGLHEGNYARYRVSHGQFDAWRAVWDPRDSGTARASGR